jgi:chromosome segregation ATPase
VAGLRKLHGDLFEAEIWSIEANSEVNILKEKSNGVRQMLQARENELVQLVSRVRTVKEHANRLGKLFQRAKEEMDEDNELFQEWVNPTKTIQELDNEIQETRSRIDLLHGGNPGAIQAYETRAVEIQKLIDRIANFDADLATMSENITTIRAQWEPELDDIVGKISDAFTFNFQKIKCSGEVTVVKDEDDFSQWSLQLRAKFRYVKTSMSPTVLVLI